MVETSGSDSRTVPTDTSVNSASPAARRWRLRCVECDSGGLADDYETARALAGHHVSDTGHHVAAEEVTDGDE